MGPEAIFDTDTQCHSLSHHEDCFGIGSLENKRKNPPMYVSYLHRRPESVIACIGAYNRVHKQVHISSNFTM